jgi:hypothetical protein
MSEQIVEKISGSGDLVRSTKSELRSPPTAHTASALWHSRITWVKDSRPTPEEKAPRSLDPYWEITEYTSEEFDALLEMDRLTPELAEKYKDLLED